MTTQAVNIDGKPAAVYRLFDASDTLLYVGVTGHINGRLGRHAKTQPWWPQVARKTMTWYGSREEADYAETAAIRTETPVHNIQKRRAPHVRKQERAGRPEIGGAVLVRLGALLPHLDAYAAENGIKRAEAIRRLISTALTD